MSFNDPNMSPEMMGMRGPIEGEEVPSRLFYVLALFIALGGIVLFASFLVSGLSGMTDNLAQAVVPGSQDLALSEPGTYTIFHEYKSVVEGRTYMGNVSVSDMEIKVSNKQTGEAVQLVPPVTNSNYNFGGRSGYNIYDFTINEPGTYVLHAQYRDERQNPETVLAVSQGFVEDLLLVIFGGIGIMFASIGLSAMTFIVAYVRRKKARDRQDMMQDWNYRTE